MSVPVLPPVEAQARDVFLALMWSLSYPGRIHDLPNHVSEAPANFIAIGGGLLDLETSFCTLDEALAENLALTTGLRQAPDAAAYQFYPYLDERAIESIKQAPVGSMMYPDDAATLIVGCRFGSGMTMKLRGPGINGEQSLQLEVNPKLWDVRARSRRYPLGWDLFLVDGGRIAGIPRTTEIEIIL